MLAKIHECIINTLNRSHEMGQALNSAYVKAAAVMFVPVAC